MVTKSLLCHQLPKKTNKSLVLKSFKLVSWNILLTIMYSSRVSYTIGQILNSLIKNISQSIILNLHSFSFQTGRSAIGRSSDGTRNARLLWRQFYKFFRFLSQRCWSISNIVVVVDLGVHCYWRMRKSFVQWIGCRLGTAVFRFGLLIKNIWKMKEKLKLNIFK